MVDKVFHVLFLSRRNSARSIMAEAVLNGLENPHFAAYSAGTEPAAEIDPDTLELLQQTGLSTDGLRPKHFKDFGAEGAHDLDFVFTLNDEHAGEPMPEWPGLPVTAHWESSDPVLAEGEPWERKQAFSRALMELDRRLKIFTNLPLSSLDRLSVQTQIDEIGRSKS